MDKYFKISTVDGHEQESEQGDKSGKKNEDEKDCMTVLPFEIMNKTFAQLPHDERLTTTSLVCKKFMDVNRAYIYKFIHINLGKQGQGADTPCLEEFGQCFTILLKHEHLRGRVLSMSLKVHHHDLYLQVQGHLDNLVKHLKSLKELSLNPPPARYDLPPNPTTTFLRLDYHYNTSTFWRGCPNLPTIPPLELTHFFHIAHIRKLQIEHISFAPHMQRHDPFSAHRDHESLISDLRFLSCSPETVGNLPLLLRLPHSLNRFVLETTCPFPVAQNPRARPHTMKAKLLDKALTPHSATLEDLTLAFSAGATFKGKSTMSLATWPNLTRLAIPEAFLVTTASTTPLHETLPWHLQALQLQHQLASGPLANNHTINTATHIRGLGELALWKSGFCSELAHLVVWYQGQGQGQLALDEAALDKLQTLKGLFASVGTVFEWCFGEDFAGTPFGRALGVRCVGDRGANVRACLLEEEGEGEEETKLKPKPEPGLYYDEDTHAFF